MAARDSGPARHPGTSPAPGRAPRLAALPCGRRSKYLVLVFWIASGLPLDTIVVRSVLVTALNLDLSDRIWWPGRLARRPGTVTGAPGTPVTSGHQ